MDKRFKKVFSSIKTRAEGVSSGHGSSSSRSGGMSITAPLASSGTPEGDLLNAIHLFVSTGGPDNPKPGEEFLHLPVIVDNAESSPAAAAQAATALRQYLSAKNSSRPYIHYNSIMLLRILAQNPGYTFTRHLGEAKFLAAIKDLLRNGRDPSVWQILGETLDYFSQDPGRIADEGLQPLRDLWLREKAKRPQIQLQTPAASQARGQYQQQQPPMIPPRPGSNNNNASPSRPHLPSPTELVARISEANTSATLLTQLVQSTPQAEIPDNALIREFSDRCKLAARSMHAYIEAEEPAPPDADTLTTLIETNDVISIALEGHRKAVAAALREREQFAAVGNARVGDVGEVPVAPVMHGARDVRERRGSSPVSPMTPHTPDLPPAQQQQGSAGVFRF